MFRTLLLMVLACAGVACGGAEEPALEVASYEEALEVQSRLMREITGVLEGVTDEASAEEAAPRIEELSAELQQLAARMNAMPPLSFEEQQRLTLERAEANKAARRNSGTQMLKIEQYPALKEAWKRGMQSGA